MQGVKLEIQETGGDRQVVEATPIAIRSALTAVGTTVEFIICCDDSGRFMQDDGVQLEYGENREGEETRLYRAAAGGTRLHGSLAAFLSFAAGGDEWLALLLCYDVSDELRRSPWRTALQVAVRVVLILLGGVAVFFAWRWVFESR